MKESLRPAELDLLRRASNASADLEIELFLAGGTVRDFLYRRRTADLDIVAAGGGLDFASELAGRLGAEVVAHSQFGTAKLRIEGVEVDLAAARTETYSHPGALPAVSPGTMDQDLARRDFSINAMAVSLGEGSWGDLLDPFQGRADLQSGLIRVLHPDSFQDDATRILRAVRYSRSLGFRIEEETERLLCSGLSYLEAISSDRVRHELERILREPQAAGILLDAQELGVLAAIHPALRVEPAVLKRLGETAAGPGQRNDLRLLAVFAFSASDSERSGLVERLNMGGRWAAVVRDVGKTRATFVQLEGEKIRPSQVFGLLRGLDPAAIEGCALASGEPVVSERLDLYLTELRHVRPALNGDDLMALGVPEGPLVGQLLQKLLTARLEGLVSTREDEETMVRRSLEGG